MHKNDPQRHSLQQNKKSMLTAAAYFKVSTPRDSKEMGVSGIK